MGTPSGTPSACPGRRKEGRAQAQGWRAIGTRVARLGIWMTWWWHASLLAMACQARVVECHVLACGVPRRASDLLADKAAYFVASHSVQLNKCFGFHNLQSVGVHILEAHLDLLVGLFLYLSPVVWMA